LKGGDSLPFDSNGIKQFRLNVGLSQRGFAEAVGVPHSTVYRWEKGISLPNANHLGAMFDLGHAYSVDPNSLFPTPGKNEWDK
jgi:transcriptional regulator with XRE-family HTH domain